MYMNSFIALLLRFNGSHLICLLFQAEESLKAQLHYSLFSEKPFYFFFFFSLFEAMRREKIERASHLLKILIDSRLNQIFIPLGLFFKYLIYVKAFVDILDNSM